MKIIYHLKKPTINQSKSILELDNQRRKKIEDKIGQVFTNEEWYNYKQFQIRKNVR